MRKDLRVNVPFVRRITIAGTTNLGSPGTIYLYNCQYSCPSAGTGWSLTIQDRATPPNVFYTNAALAVTAAPTVVQNLNFPTPCVGGLDFITAGTPGVLVVSGNYSQN